MAKLPKRKPLDRPFRSPRAPERQELYATLERMREVCHDNDRNFAMELKVAVDWWLALQGDDD